MSHCVAHHHLNLLTPVVTELELDALIYHDAGHDVSRVCMTKAKMTNNEQYKCENDDKSTEQINSKILNRKQTQNQISK